MKNKSIKVYLFSFASLAILAMFIASAHAVEGDFPHPDCVAQVNVWNQNVVENQCNSDKVSEVQENGFATLISRPNSYDKNSYQILDAKGNFYLIKRNGSVLLIKREAGMLQYVQHLVEQSSCNAQPEDIRRQDGKVVFSQEIGAGDLLALDDYMSYYVYGNFDSGFDCYAKITAQISIDEKRINLLQTEFVQDPEYLDTDEEKVFQVCFDEVYKSYVANGKVEFTTIELQGFYQRVANQCASGVQLFLEGCEFHGVKDLMGWYAIKYDDKLNSDLVPVQLKQTKILSIPEEGLYDYCVYTKEYGRRYREGFARGAGFNIEMFSPLLKGELFKTGKLETAQFNQNGFTLNDYEGVDISTINMVFKGEEYELIQTVEASDGNYTITLKYKNKEEIVVNIKDGNIEGSTYAYLIWAGDLDRDGKLDLILNAPESYAALFHLRLFLSSKADEGKMLKQVVEKSTPGI